MTSNIFLQKIFSTYNDVVVTPVTLAAVATYPVLVPYICTQRHVALSVCGTFCLIGTSF